MAKSPLEVARRYLLRYGTQDWKAFLELPLAADHVLVVPALNEETSLLDGFRQAARNAPGSVLVILVVNAHDAVPPEWLHQNERLLSCLGGSAAWTASGGQGFFVEDADFGLLVLDRTSPGRRLPEKQGVGLARRIGADLALALFNEGRLRSRWIATTDADARLPKGFFWTVRSAPPDTALVAHPFAHEPEGEESTVTEACAAYELWLHYYVLGLHWAGSPYALHTIGSTLSVDAAAYAAVRGFPCRAAGEDFHMVNKLLKVGAAHRPLAEPILLSSRASSRVPFGTGPGLRRMETELSAGGVNLMAPRVFVALSGLLESFDVVVRTRTVAPFDAWLATDASAGASSHVAATGLREEVIAALEQCPDPGVLRRRLHGSFDALATLRFLHAERDSGAGQVPWAAALAGTPFGPPAGYNLSDALRWLVQAHQRLPSRVGPGLT